MGDCFKGLKRNYEAAVAYEKVFTLFPKDANAAKACFEAVRCYAPSSNSPATSATTTRRRSS